MDDKSIDLGGKQNDTIGSYAPYSERPETYIVPIVFAVIFLVGVLGNGTVICIFAKEKTVRTNPNIYIFNLALGDLLVIVTCVPFTSIIYTFESWPWGKLICKLSEVTKDVSIGVSVFTLTALSATRYYAIANPIRRHVSTEPLGKTVVINVAIWIVSFISTIPTLIFSDVESAYLENNNTVKFCSPFPEELGPGYKQSMVLLKFLIYYALPLCLIGVFYKKMAGYLILSARNIPGENDGERSNQAESRTKVANMALVFIAIFALCFLPYHIFMLWFHFHPTAEDDYDIYWHFFRIIAFCFSFMNSCVNPIALYFSSKTFRTYFKQYLLYCLRPRT